MKMPTLFLMAAAIGLSGCNKGSSPATNNMAAPAADTAATVSGDGTGTVTGIDAAAGKVTLNHGPIPQAGWPAMTMTFDADPALLGKVSVGQIVRFHMTAKGMAARVTSIEPG